MKWYKRGHEFDEMEEYYKNTKEIYFYGAVQSAEPYIEELERAIREANDGILDINISFVDRSIEKQRNLLCGKKVNSPQVFYEEFFNKSALTVLCIAEDRAQEVWEQMKQHGIKRKQHAFTAYDFFKYLSLFIWYRYKKTYLYMIDIFAHTLCNLNCKHCFVQTYRGVRKQADITNMKHIIDVIFNKIDFLEKGYFGIAEGFLGGGVFEEAFNYIVKNYSKKFNEIQVVTNVTIIPQQSLIEILKHKQVRVIVDDYRDNVKLARENYSKVIQILEKNDIRYESLKRPNWDESCFGERRTVENVEQLCNKVGECNCHAKGFPYIGYKEGTTRMYSCVFHAINTYLNLIEEHDDDSLDFATATPLEIIEFLLGFSEKGYLSACAYCNGMFEGIEVNHVPVAVQLENL